MKISKQSRRDAKALFNVCRVGGLLDESRVRTAVSAVVARQPRGYLGTLTHLSRLVRLDEAQRTAVVESAVPLLADFQVGIKGNLEKKYGPGLAVSFSVNPMLIGGLRIKVGCDVLDGSVATRLETLVQNF